MNRVFQVSYTSRQLIVSTQSIFLYILLMYCKAKNDDCRYLIWISFISFFFALTYILHHSCWTFLIFCELCSPLHLHTLDKYFSDFLSFTSSYSLHSLLVSRLCLFKRKIFAYFHTHFIYEDNSYQGVAVVFPYAEFHLICVSYQF